MKKLIIDSKPLLEFNLQQARLSEVIGGFAIYDEQTARESVFVLTGQFPTKGIIWKYPEQVLSLKMQCRVAELVQKYCEDNPDYNVEILTTSVTWLSRIKFDEQVEIIEGTERSILRGYGSTIDYLWNHQQ